MKRCGFSLVLFYLFPILAHSQIITTFGGGGTGAGLGDGGIATLIKISDPNSGAFDNIGNFYCASAIGGNRIRKINNSSIITTVVGSSSGGYCGDGGHATAACLDLPLGVKLDTFGNIYIADHQNARIRKVEKSTGIISTIAGNGVSGYNGDGIPATSAEIWADDVCLDKYGNVYIADFNGRRVRKINSFGMISTIAGTGIVGSSGDGGAATNAELNPNRIAIDDNDNLFIADPVYNYVRKINPAGIISTVAGNGSWIYSGDGVSATSASLQPSFICLDHKAGIFIGDEFNLMVFKVDTLGILHRIAGNGMTGYNGDGIPATSASIDYPSGLTVDLCDNLYIAEANNKRIRKVTFNPSCNSTLNNEIINGDSFISIYPIPFKSELTINSNKRICRIKIENIIGQIEFNQPYEIESGKINLEDLPDGIHILTILYLDNATTIKKILKQ